MASRIEDFESTLSKCGNRGNNNHALRFQQDIVRPYKNATIVDNEAEILVDRLTTLEGTTDVPVEEIDQDCNESSDRPLPASFLTRSIPVSLDKTKPVCAAFRGLLHTFGDEGDGTETVSIMCFTLNICVLISFEIFKANETVDANVQEGDVEPATTGRVDNDEPKEATVNHLSFFSSSLIFTFMVSKGNQLFVGGCRKGNKAVQ